MTDLPPKSPTASSTFMEELYWSCASSLAAAGLPVNQAEVGRRLGETSSRVGDWRKGKVGLTLNHLTRMVECWNENAQEEKLPQIVRFMYLQYEGQAQWSFSMEAPRG